eukprot:gene12396-12482_t
MPQSQTSLHRHIRAVFPERHPLDVGAMQSDLLELPSATVGISRVETVLSVAGLSLTIAGRSAVRDVSLSMEFAALPVPIPGTVPAPGAMPPGCAFAPRCQRADAPCAERPALRLLPPDPRVSALLELNAVSRDFVVRRRHPFAARRVVSAVSDASFSIAPGETLGLVGESGSGKSTLGRMVAGLLTPSAGSVAFEGEIAHGRSKAHAARVQIVFQDALGALNPRLTIGRQLREPFDVHGIGSKPEREARVLGLLDEMGLAPSLAHRYGPARRGARLPPGPPPRPHAAAGRAAKPDRPTAGLPLPSALPHRHRALPNRDPGPDLALGRPRRRLPSGRRNPGEGGLMLRLVVIKLTRAIATIALCVTLVFIVLRVSGDPATSLLPENSPPAMIEEYRERWGLNEPLPVQYLRYVEAVLHGDFGRSFADNRDAWAVVSERIPATLLLGSVAFTLSLTIGLPLGIWAAIRRNTWIDRLAMGVAVAGYALPHYFLGILLILLFSLTLRILPSSGSGTVCLSRTRSWRIPPVVLLALGWLGVMVFVAIFADQLSPYHYTTQNLRLRMAPPVLWGGTCDHPLGTDNIGRDVLSRLMWGARFSILIAVLGTLIGSVLGTLLGIIAAQARGIVEETIMALVDFQAAVPFVILALAVLAFFGNSFSLFILLVGLDGWERYARLARGLILSAQESGYTAAARAIGAGRMRVVALHIMPNIASALVVQVTLNFPGTMLLETSLSFLGLGIQPPLTSLGLLLGSGRSLLLNAWWISVFPGIAIFLTTLSMSLAGDWLRDRLDPTLEQS